MTKVRELLFTEPWKRVKALGGKEAIIKIHCDKPRLALADIKVQVGDMEADFPKFAKFTPIETSPGKYEDLPYVYSVVFDETPASLFLIGEFSVIYVGIDKAICEEILYLFRDAEAYDAGFKRQKIIPTSIGFLLIYECGVAYIEKQGDVRWHTKLFADDILDSHDDEALYYWTEIEGKFAIRVNDGKKIKLPI